MRIVVLIKAVRDSAALSVPGDALSDSCEPVVMNPYDEHALEEALRIRESSGGEVIALSLGGEGAMKVLRDALASGADRAVLVREDRGAPPWTGRTTARVLAAAIDRLAPDLVLAGKQAIDEDGAQVAERIAQSKGWVHASAVSRLSFESGVAVADREVEEGRYVLEFPLPAVVTVEKGINAPRYPTLPNLLKARTRPVQEISVGDLGIAAANIRGALSVEDLVPIHQNRCRIVLDGELSVAVKRLMTHLEGEIGSAQFP